MRFHTLKWTAGLVAIGVLAQGEAANAQQVGRLLYRGTAEYGWSHNGVRSWGGNWGVRAQNEAQVQIRNAIASMVNMRDLDTFTHTNHSSNTELAGAYGPGGVSGKIGYAENMDATAQTRWVNANNFLIKVGGVRIKPGTAYSMTRDEGPFGGGRSWEASATMLYDYEIWGLPKGGGSGDTDPKEAVHYTLRNDSGRTVHFHMQPSGRRYSLGPRQTFRGMSHQVNGKPPTITLEDSGHTYRLKEGHHKFWWMRDEQRIGLDIEGR